MAVAAVAPTTAAAISAIAAERVAILYVGCMPCLQPEAR
jgi:hypothetical protein